MCPDVQLEWIIWKDAVGVSDRVQLESLKTVTLAICTNIGWVEHENEELVVLANGTLSTGEVDHLVIPKSCIVERTKVGKKRKG